MNQEPSQNQLRKEFDKPPTPELKPEIRHRYDPEKRLLPGRPSFGGGNAVQSIEGKKVEPRNEGNARKSELEKQLILEQRKFGEMQKRELRKKKERLAEKQAPERFSIKNELAEIGERKASRDKNGAMKMLYQVSGQSAKDAERIAALERREKALDQELGQSINQFEKSQEDERLRFGEVIEFYRNEASQTISELGRDQERMKSHEQAQTIQRTEGRDGR